MADVRRLDHAGLSVLAFDVAVLDATFARVGELGARAVVTPRPSPEPGVRMAFVADPEGNLVELLSRPRILGLSCGARWQCRDPADRRAALGPKRFPDPAGRRRPRHRRRLVAVGSAGRV
jgi:hypothetical protein